MLLPVHCRQGSSAKRTWNIFCFLMVRYAIAAFAVCATGATLFMGLPPYDNVNFATSIKALFVTATALAVGYIFLWPMIRADREIAKEQGIEPEENWL